MSDLIDIDLESGSPPPRSGKAAGTSPKRRKISLDLPCDPSALGIARREVALLLEGSEFNTSQLGDVHLAVGEALANAIRHGCPLGKQGSRIQLRAAWNVEGLVLEVTDPGPGFDPSLLPEPDVTLLQEGGMGVFFMRRVMDSVAYRHDEGGNTVRMAKYKCKK
jgi:anti-sigma regulatory factor (Ser/Thr protein kinase)